MLPASFTKSGNAFHNSSSVTSSEDFTLPYHPLLSQYLCTISCGNNTPALIFVSPFSSLLKYSRLRSSSFLRNAEL